MLSVISVRQIDGLVTLPINSALSASSERETFSDVDFGITSMLNVVGIGATFVEFDGEITCVLSVSAVIVGIGDIELEIGMAWSGDDTVITYLTISLPITPVFDVEISFNMVALPLIVGTYRKTKPFIGDNAGWVKEDASSTVNRTTGVTGRNWTKQNGPTVNKSDRSTGVIVTQD
jgi:hypothetical protein